MSIISKRLFLLNKIEERKKGRNGFTGAVSCFSEWEFCGAAAHKSVRHKIIQYDTWPCVSQAEAPLTRHNR